jgi:cobalt-precorrin-5B (C1)-methyltransferase
LRVTGKKSVRKKLRRGFTTGTCAAAGAKAAAQALFAALANKRGGRVRPSSVTVTLPGGSALKVRVKNVKVSKTSAVATIVKDAGDDPDVTHRASIVTEVALRHFNSKRTGVSISGGAGVGVVTKPGLKVPPGRAAINPVPLGMIRRAVLEAAVGAGVTPSVRVTVSVSRGVDLAKKTMNERLGIIGGISILGTTGIVEPLSLSAYRDSITCGVSVALAGGLFEVVFSTGRSTEKVVEAGSKLPPAAFILTGDHMGYALKDARRFAESGQRLKAVTVAGQFGKFSKLAAGHFETHCADASIDPEFLAKLSKKHGVGVVFLRKIRSANTAREIFFILKDGGFVKVLREVCSLVRANSREITGNKLKVRSILVGYENDIICRC